MLFNLSRHFTCLNNELQVWTRWRHVDQRQICPVSHRSGLCYRCFQNQLKSCLLVLSELWREGLTMVMTLMTLKTWITYPKLQQNIFKIHGFFMLKWYAWLFYVLLFFRSHAESIHMYLIRPMDGLWVTRKPYGVWCCHPFISGSSHNRVTWKKKKCNSIGEPEYWNGKGFSSSSCKSPSTVYCACARYKKVSSRAHDVWPWFAACLRAWSNAVKLSFLIGVWYA